ncbi:MAG: glycosyltransferase 87 family protein [Cyanobacteria bacterium]|nr:glycosyltransferase 87 family protein [Cyanobacteriota bacterium]
MKLFVAYGAVMVVGSLGVASTIASRMSDPTFWPNTFLCYRMAYLVLTPETRHHIFDFKTQAAVDEKLYGDAENMSFSNHPPTNFLLFAPLALLPHQKSFVVWNVLSVVVLTAGLSWLWMSSTEEKMRWTIPLTLGASAVVTLPGAISIYYASYVVLVAGLLASFFAAHQSRRPLVAGVLLALLFIKPNFTLFALALAIGKKCWKSLILCCAILFVWVMATGFTVGFENIFSYPQIAVYADLNYPGVFPEKMVCIRAILCQFVPDAVAMKICSVISLMAFALFIFLFRRAQNPAHIQHLMSMGVLCGLVLSVHSHLYEAVVLTVGFTLSAISLFRKDGEFDWSKRCFDWIMVLYPILSWLVFAAMQSQFYIGLLVVNIVLFLLGIKYMFKSESVSAETGEPG